MLSFFYRRTAKVCAHRTGGSTVRDKHLSGQYDKRDANAEAEHLRASGFPFAMKMKLSHMEIRAQIMTFTIYRIFLQNTFKMCFLKAFFFSSSMSDEDFSHQLLMTMPSTIFGGDNELKFSLAKIVLRENNARESRCQ